MLANLRNYAVGVLFLAVLALGLTVREQFKATAQLRTDLDLVTQALASEQKMRAAEVGSLTTRLEAAKTLQVRKEKRDDATHQALQKSPQWASERIPDDVADALGM